MNIHSRGSLIFHGVYFGIVAVLSVLLLVVSTVDDSDGVHITVVAIAMVLISMFMLASFFRSVHVHRGSSVEIDARRKFDKALAGLPYNSYGLYQSYNPWSQCDHIRAVRYRTMGFAKFGLELAFVITPDDLVVGQEVEGIKVIYSTRLGYIRVNKSVTTIPGVVVEERGQLMISYSEDPVRLSVGLIVDAMREDRDIPGDLRYASADELVELSNNLVLLAVR